MSAEYFWQEMDARYPTPSAVTASGKVGLYQRLMLTEGMPLWAYDYYRAFLRRYGMFCPDVTWPRGQP